MKKEFSELEFQQLFANLNKLSLLIGELLAKNKDFKNNTILAEDLNRIRDFEDLTATLNYLNEDILEEIIVLNNYQLNQQYLVNLLPFLKSNAIAILVNRLREINLETIMAILPFINEEQLKTIINNKITIASDFIDVIAPFILDREYLYNIFINLEQFDNKLIRHLDYFTFEQKQELIKKYKIII